MNLSSKLQIASEMSVAATLSGSRIIAAACVLCCVLCCAGLAAPAAQADVLEIGPQGAVWKTAPAPNPDVSERSVEGLAEVESPIEANVPAVLTTVDSAAGPEDWQPHVAALARKYDVSPSLLEAVVWQESRWNTRAVSPAGARGLAQLMPGTARQLGVDSSDPHANLEGGARYLRMQLDHFGGDIEKALAAYNAGPRRVERANGIPRIRETREYVAAIMARLSQPVRR